MLRWVLAIMAMLVLLGFARLGVSVWRLQHDKGAWADLQTLSDQRTFQQTAPLLLRHVGSRRHDVLVIPAAPPIGPGVRNGGYVMIVLDTHGYSDESPDPDNVLQLGDFQRLKLPCATIDRLRLEGITVDPHVRLHLLSNCQSR